MSSNAIHSDFANVYDDSKPLKLSLRTYMDQYAISIEDTETEANFISMTPQYRKRFFVPDDAIPQLMDLLNKCYKDEIFNHLYEIQDSNEVEVSGLVFEFRFESEQIKIEFDSVVPNFIRILFRDILARWIAFSEDKEDHYCFYLATINPTYDCKTLMFKSTFRIVIPSIMVSADVRYFIYQRVWQSVDIKLLFQRKLNYHIRNCFMRSLRSSPLILLGSCDVDQSEPLKLRSVIKTEIENGITEGDSIPLSNIDNVFDNLINETSINYPMRNGVVEKSHYLPMDVCVQKMEEDNDDKQQFQIAYDEAHATFSKMIIMDCDIEIIRDMISMLSDDRFEDLDSWLEVMKSLGSEGDRFYSLAVIATKERAKHLVSWEEFQFYWNEIVNSSTRNQYSSKALRYWAACDSPSQMHRYINETIKKMLVRDIRDSLIQGRISHSHIASYLHFMFKNTYITHNITKSDINWYEFVTPLSRDVETGQLYKWRNIGSYPDSLSIFISRDFKDIASKVHNDLKSLKLSFNSEEDKNDPKIKIIQTLFSAFDRSIISIFNNKYKRSVIDEATVLFKRNHFIKQLDKTPNIIGVGNGVVEFNGSENRLLQHYHTYPISLFTDTQYVPYDEDCPYVKTVYQMLYSLIPEDEEDALHFLLYYFSTSLDWYQKESLFLIIHGGGCHAIDTPIRMFDGSIKMVQNVNVGDQLMGDDDTPRTVQELFRGNDDMFSIIPKKGSPFEVNKDHVLSLRFTGLTSIEKRSDGSSMITWFELNNSDEPVKKSIIANDTETQMIIDNRPIIRDGDIIDVKVKDLLKWSSHWITNGNVALYKSKSASDLTDSFSIEAVGKGDYYGFELDGNHRYLDGQFYVHHNSNGKSVLLELFRRTLGEQYARKMQLSFITDQSRGHSSSADPAMMELKDARLVYYSESDRNEKVNVAKIKEITGGETLSGRQLYKEQENFRANCNHIVTTNHRFIIETTEHAVWRRFISYKFKICFKFECDPSNPLERPRDPALINKIMNDKRYHEAFMSILMHYRSKLYSEYDGQILKVPHPTIIKETEEYRQSEDIFQRYIMQQVYYYKGSNQTMTDLISNFRQYYRVENNEPYRAKTADMTHTFRNTILGSHIHESGGIYSLNDFYSTGEGETPIPGSILFTEWIKEQ